MLAKDAGLESFSYDDGQIKFDGKFPVVQAPAKAPEVVPAAKQGKVENDPSTATRESMFARAYGRPLPTLAETPQ